MTLSAHFSVVGRWNCRSVVHIYETLLNPEQILTKEAMSMPNRTVIIAGKEPSEGQMDALLKALKQKLKKELAETPIPAPRTV
jgi:hypothetical protein